MRVIHIVESFGSGTKEIVRLLANYQVSQGMAVEIWHGVVPETGVSYKCGFDDSVGWWLVPGFKGRRGIAVVTAFFQLKKKLQTAQNKNKSLIVHVHSTIAGGVGRLVCWRLGIKSVFTPHGFWALRTDISPFLKAIVIRLERAVNSFTNITYVACSNSERTCIEKSVPSAHVETIENGIDHGSLSRYLDDKAKSEKLRLVSVGRICTQKNFNELSVLQPLLGQGVEMTVVGDGPARAVADLEKNGITVTGWQEREMVYALLSDADFIVMPSLWEGLAVCGIEAMALGVPVIAKKSPGCSDLVEEKQTGFLYDDQEDLKTLIESLVDKSVNTEHMPSAARKAVAERFDWKLMAKNYEALYVSILGNSPQC